MGAFIKGNYAPSNCQWLTKSENAKKANRQRQECSHKKTVAINEEGHAGIYCSGCGKQLEKEC